MKFAASLLALFTASASVAGAADLRSVSKLTFGPKNTLFAADWKNGTVHALSLPPAAVATGHAFNIIDANARLRTALGTNDFRIMSLAMRPGTDEAYLALGIGKALTPAIAVASPNGSIRLLNLRALPDSTEKLVKSDGSLSFWRTVPEAAYTVTDMQWHDNRLYVAGLANQNFASTLRVLSYPFGRQTLTSVEMYHTAHDQWETRAPIRAMTFATINGRDSLLAAYLCSPLVVIPTAALVNGTHVKAISLSELGIAGIPQDMFVYTAHGMDGSSTPMVFVNERYRSALAFPLAGAAKRAASGGMTTPVNMMQPPPAGSEVGAMALPLAGVVHAADQSDRYIVTVRRDLDTGAAQIVSYNKNAFFRLSDYKVSEYQFPRYRYTPGMQQKFVLPMQNMLKAEEQYPELVRTAEPR